MDEVADEAAECLGDNGELRVEAVRRADVSATLVKEVCRLYPSAWWFSREVMQPVTIGGRELKRRHLAVDLPMAIAARSPALGIARQIPDDAALYHRRLCAVRRRSARLRRHGGRDARTAAARAGDGSRLSLHRRCPNPAPWPKASVTLIPPAMRSTSNCGRRGRAACASRRCLDLPYVPPIGIAVAEALQS